MFKRFWRRPIGSGGGPTSDAVPMEHKQLDDQTHRLLQDLSVYLRGQLLLAVGAQRSNVEHFLIRVERRLIIEKEIRDGN